MLIDNCAIAQRAPDRSKFDQMTAEWIAAGNKITTLKSGAFTDPTPEAEAKSRARGNAASRRTPKKPTHRKHSGEDLASFAKRMLDGGFV
ncbi:hypothetical protein [Azotobacter chroococcum]|uniref:hypothetical protein n=1 Tax=Azotobacter chroococcum TaxID=353 RepID=UPI0010AEC8CA|nr:hypothetical protein [Azotobacter chroococcum]TKD30019.1 hypothetical protein FCG41_24395 [Azotobacter chroococcum]